MARSSAPVPEEDDFSVMIRKLLRFQKWTHSWDESTFDDAVQDVALLALQTPEDVALARSFRSHFATPKYAALKEKVFHSIKVIRERSRQRHRVEVPKTSVDYDGGNGKRVRRDLPPNQSLDDFTLEDSDELKTLWILETDVASAMAELTATQRQIVILKVHEKQTWTAISRHLKRSRTWVEHQFHAAIAQLRLSLLAYDSVSEY